MLKALEALAKTVLAWLAAPMLWRPGRRRRLAERLAAARQVLLVRIDARVGEALLSTPLVGALKRARPELEVDLLVHPRSVPLLAGSPGLRATLPFPRRRLWLGPLSPSIRSLRRARYDVVIDCSNWTAPSVTAALISRLIAPRAVLVGPGAGQLRAFRDIPVEARADTRSEVAQRLHLLSPLVSPVPDAPLAFRSLAGSPAPAALSALVKDHAFAVVNPGGRLGWRRVPPSAFATAARRLIEKGLRVVVTWGPGEEGLAREVVEAAPGSSLAPKTSLDELAWLLAHARLSVCNNTGPMHLSVALGTPTLGLFLLMEPERWGHPYSPHRMLDLTAPLNSGEALEPLLQEAVDALLRA
jgi:ADP-heptose:LPS heptosyltransferase